MPDLRWFEHPGGLEAPACHAFSITPNDSNELSATTRALWVGTAGNVAVVLLADAGSVTIVGVPAGTLLPVAAKKVLSTGTTAGSIIGLY